MSQSIRDLYPRSLWSHFEQICQLPHPSKHEERLRDYLVAFGKNHGLDTTVDGVGNVILRKPATKGMENRAVVCLQGHMDMVPQKNEDTTHDFLVDPIRPRIDGEVVRATGTTLGADNGIGLSAILAVFEAKDLAHGPLEALITVDEEAGMTGAKGLGGGLLRAEYLLNLDSEDEEEICVGCAGGLDTTITVPAPRETLPAGFAAFELYLSGLRGGHSGMDIALGRGNSNVLVARMLFQVLEAHDARVVAIEGGNLRNVIPRETRATLAFPAERADAVKKLLEGLAAAIRGEFAETDPGIRFELRPVETPKDAIRPQEGRQLVRALYCCPNGPAFMTPGMPNLAETSTNLASIRTGPDAVTIATLQRSSQETRKVELAHRVRAAFELAGGHAEHGNGYSGWNPNLNSPLLHRMAALHEKKFGRKPVITATHGGLECGIIMGNYPKLDAVSIGPTIKFPHSPDEHVYIASVGRFWDYLVELLGEIPEKAA
jgi:dipeptidase D